ncbi:type B 50S ribosomal protein L31 [Acinetobacter nectaris]|jgi:large subunit ribosomal protein L31|uniref:50S ribosomal protein L31 n=2 Tax=Acinetobacter TaxID=469 RepID=V2T7Y8_9GAMM|nr:type B 50S ribosomal protein L31 [Acinetobacter nectaris]ESK38458.1 50S ribosomal protein L31 type B [Acinetobacter nectaris CIP 110549]MCF9000122.1 type B 50S ribosomal protein L31 [Acinetobacter nectaris]MCF9027046.1 type B 50S ribosomal protein L31 [Acinetobacter nectaris]MCF9034824.1 type B 50S ribosomal protein L31 [Acinetobacter nectaris]MCF9045689.1 type B 50S ribosomal protein L31 [Acinetobacter nectaris]
MRNIHPKYQQVLFHDTNADAYFIIGSTLQPKQTKVYEGKEYPYMTLDISSASHPFYTGEVRQASNEGRVANFNRKFGRFAKKKA